MMIWIHTAAFISGFLLDFVLGDPDWLPHPVRFMGRLIGWLDRRLMGEKHPGEEKKAQEDVQSNETDTAGRSGGREFRKGILLVITVLAVTAAVTTALLAAVYSIDTVLGWLAETIMTYQILAARCLYRESMKVYQKLKAGNLTAAREAVSMIVGRDTDILDEDGVAQAAVETVAESTSDGVIAPMLYTALGGPVLGMLYKAVNTMDSMVGYRNSRYLYFGRAAAKLDDAVNLIPSRLSALLMIAVSFLPGSGLDGKRAWRVWRRDAGKHASPNAGQTESACAGALGITLAGDTVYGGRVVHKPKIGENTRDIACEDIRRSNWLMYHTAFAGELLCVLVMVLIGKGTL